MSDNPEFDNITNLKGFHLLDRISDKFWIFPPNGIEVTSPHKFGISQN
jgi:hypothetical protein